MSTGGMPDKSGQALYEPEHTPRRHRARRKGVLRPTWQCCLRLLAAIGSVLGAALLYFIGSAVVEVAKNVTSPHSGIVHSPAWDRTPSAGLGVGPLINESSTFDVLATVWLDVTQYLESGHTLPGDIAVYRYKQPNGRSTSEAVLYSDLIFRNASMQSGLLQASTHLRVPAQPFYEQPLGPAMLRATFRIVPHATPQDYQYKQFYSIYPAFMPIGPRSPASKLLTPLSKAHSTTSNYATPLDEAMEQSAINVNLIALLPSDYQKFLESKNTTLRYDYGMDPPMYDGAPSNRCYLNATNEDPPPHRNGAVYVAADHLVMVPHIRTRSRIILLHEARTFDQLKFFKDADAQLNSLLIDCENFKNYSKSGGDAFISGGSCQRPFRASIHENILKFVDEEKPDAPEQYYYAPFLTQQATSAAHRHHRTIPRFPPYSKLSTPQEEGNKEKKTKKKKKGEEHCMVPMLDVDETGRFFEVDWDVNFSSHTHMRGTLAESLDGGGTNISKASTYIDMGEEIRVRYTGDESTFWALSALLFGDREHPNSRLLLVVAHNGLMIVSIFGLMVCECKDQTQTQSGDGTDNHTSSCFAPTFSFTVTLLYWWTRLTSEGLSWKAQSLAVASNLVKVFNLANRANAQPWLSFATLARTAGTVYCIVIIVLQVTTLLHIDFITLWRPTRRPPTKRERDSQRLDGRMSWLFPSIVVALLFLFVRYIVPRDYNVVGTSSCRSGDAADDADKDSTLYINTAIFIQLTQALANASVIIQIVHNFRARTYAGALKIYMLSATVLEAFDMAMKRIEFVSGWMAQRDPISLTSLVYFLAIATFAVQAILYPGIPQVEGEGYDDEE